MAFCHLLAPSWLLTDARLPGHGVAAARRLPPGTMIIVRSDDLPDPQRLSLIRVLRRIAQARQLRLFIAAIPVAMASRLGADGIHLRDRSAAKAMQARRLGLLSSAPVHDRREARAAARSRIDHALVSPLYPTRSHVGAGALGNRRFLQLARLSNARVSALGGMTARRHRQLLRCSAYGRFRFGWAAIDAWEKR